MKKWFVFDTGESPWINPDIVAPIFLDKGRRELFFSQGKEGGSFNVYGLEGTEDLKPMTGQINASLIVILHPDHGAKLNYGHWNGKTRTKIQRYSRGDLRLLGQYVRSFYDTPLDIGLFVSFEQGWSAVREFMENDGALPHSIEWVSGSEIPQIPDSMFFAGA